MAGDTTAPRSAITAKGAQTRRRIVTAAAQLMFERGVAATAIEDVKVAAEVSGSQMYHYFSGKDALVRAVIDYQGEAILANQASVRLDSTDGLREWRDVVVGIEQAIGCRGGCPLGSLGGQLAEVDPQARSDLSARFERWEVAIRNGLETMHSRGELVEGADPALLAGGLLAALQGGLLLTQLHRTTKPLETALDTMLQLIGLLTIPVSKRPPLKRPTEPPPTRTRRSTRAPAAVGISRSTRK